MPENAGNLIRRAKEAEGLAHLSDDGDSIRGQLLRSAIYRCGAAIVAAIREGK